MENRTLNNFTDTSLESLARECYHMMRTLSIAPDRPISGSAWTIYCIAVEPALVFLTSGGLAEPM